MILTNKHPEDFFGGGFQISYQPNSDDQPIPATRGVATWPLPLLRAWPLISSPPGGIRDGVFYILSVAGLGISEPSTVMLSFLSYAFDV